MSEKIKSKYETFVDQLERNIVMKTVDLSNCNLRDFPHELLLVKDSLEQLNLGNNQLSYLPDFIQEFKKLKILFFANNRFISIPKILSNLPSLYMLSFKGNQTQEILKKAYQRSHFVVLPSESEGWPKALAEGMFWGCVPLATKVSCVPYILDYGNRGVVLAINLENDFSQMKVLLQNQTDYKSKSEKASFWSRKYTLDVFEKEIKKLLLR